jgi:hypothetical protein
MQGQPSARCDELRPASRPTHRVATALQFPAAMVVPLIILGAAIKLAIAVAATYRTRFWWVPGTVSVGVGTAVGLHDSTRTIGQAGIMLGLVAVLLARAARAGEPVR